MKILTWNCAGAFRKKFETLKDFNADIIIIQECEDPQKAKDKIYQSWTSNYYWIGDNKNKGLGIFAKDDIILERLNWDNQGLKYFIPCKVNNDFNLLSLWCHGANSPTFGYIGQMWKYMQLNKSKFGKSIIAGDFNSNVNFDRWDRWWNHSDVVRELKELSIESLYHKYFKEEAGKETIPTFYMHKNLEKPYHIDYFIAHEDFIPKLRKISIGEPNKWLDKSDHMPLCCDFSI